jgi:peptidoglycan/LPS O-acetylase OafA/YrhL
LAGLRFTNSLFFYINPSWWFIWTLFQLYFIFPFLIILLQKNKIKLFLFLTLAITILSRLAGIYGLSLSSNLYFWMTGLFAGTRLFEFSIGMFLGYLIFSNHFNINEQLKKGRRILILSIPIYVIGFIASWTYLGSIFSNILITLGLSGIFYAGYELFFKKYDMLKTPIIWTGKYTFGIFLIHQPFLMYYSYHAYSGYQKVYCSMVLSISRIIYIRKFLGKKCE